MSGRAPHQSDLESVVPAAATAVSDVTVIGLAPYAGTVTSVTYVPDAAITGAATNSRTFNLHNRGTAGTGTTVVATLAMVAGVNAVQYDEEAIPLSGTAADLVVAEGDVLTWQSLAVGTGLADPGGAVFVEIARE